MSRPFLRSRWWLLALALCGLALLLLVTPSPAHADAHDDEAAAPQIEAQPSTTNGNEEPVRLRGRIQFDVDGELITASGGIGIVIVSQTDSGTECASTTTNAFGEYDEILAVDCTVGERVTFRLPETGDTSTTQSIPGAGPLDVTFSGLSQASLRKLGLLEAEQLAVEPQDVFVGEVVLLDNNVEQSVPAGSLVTARREADGAVCGSVGTGASGIVNLPLGSPCEVNDAVTFSLPRAGLEIDPIRLTTTEGVVRIEFNATAEQLLSLGVQSAIDELVARQASERADAPVLGGTETLIALSIIVLGSILLLFVMILGRPKPETFRRQVEGMVLVDVLGAILLLGLAEKIGDQGLVSILAAITGYAIARGASQLGQAPGPKETGEAMLALLRDAGVISSEDPDE